MQSLSNPLHLPRVHEEKNSDGGDGDEIDFGALQQADDSIPATTGRLRRTLGVWDGLGVLIGIMIGSGIFASPGVALERCGSAGMSLVVWVGAGLLVIVSSFNYMELAAMCPSAGGDFSFIRRAYGDSAAFCFAWYNFWVSKTGSQAIIATIFGEYLTWLVGGGEIGSSSVLAKIFAVLLTIALAVINCMGVRESSNLQNILTVIKLLLIVCVFVGGVGYAIGNSDTLYDNFGGGEAFAGTKGFGFFTGLVAALWAFDGWADLNFLAEEVIDPSRNIPRVMSGGIGIVTIAYVAANVAYLSVLDEEDIQDSDAIAVDFGYTLGGGRGRKGAGVLAASLALGVAIATVGSDNGSIMTGGRAFFAVARVGQAPRFLSALNVHGAPWAALAAQCSWTCVLLLLPGSSFSALLDYFGPVSWMFYAFTSSCVVRLRYTEPHAARPFTVPFYPMPPILTAVVACAIMISSLLTEPLFTGLALGFCATAFPVRWLIVRWDEASKSRGCPASLEGEGVHVGWLHVENEDQDQDTVDLSPADQDTLHALSQRFEDE